MAVDQRRSTRPASARNVLMLAAVAAVLLGGIGLDGTQLQGVLNQRFAFVESASISAARARPHRVRSSSALSAQRSSQYEALRSLPSGGHITSQADSQRTAGVNRAGLADLWQEVKPAAGWSGGLSDVGFLQSLKRFRGKVEHALDQGRKRLRTTYGVVVHDSCAWPSGDDWIIPIEAWIYRRNEDRHKTRLMLCQKLLLQMNHNITGVDEAAQRRYEERGRLIFRSIAFRGGEDGRSLKVRLGGKAGGSSWRSLSAVTDTHGRISTELRLPRAEAERLIDASGGGSVPLEIRSRLLGHEQHLATGSASLRFVEDRGLSVISDIDDTVKVTEVFLGKGVVATNTFFEEFRPVQGMQGMMRAWADQDPGMNFHFVSNSPAELLEPLRDFLRGEGFPLASLHLRPLSGILSKNQSSFKLRTVEALIERFPGRRFALVGDSGEADASTYAALFRRFPGRIAKVLIREVHPSRRVDESVFEGIERERWQVFQHASEVEVPWASDSPGDGQQRMET